ncbi:MAG: glycosyltransferase family 39 protein [Gammaproteobacteria bacterium]|nr:glycosyltransferase family 39 protein [Gammaproteobacteria bacterium]
MKTVQNQIRKPEYWLYLFITIHVVIWTLAPFLIRYTLPMDSIEGAIWGHQLELGYDKNPFLNGWLTALAVKLGGHSGWGIYFFSQLSVAICFWAVWKLGKKMMPPVYALIGVLLLEALQYYNLHAIDFNDNTLELSLWALTTLFFYNSLRQSSLKNWLLTGLFAGLSMMTKYYSIVLLLPMLAFLIFNPSNRKYFSKSELYLGLLAFLIIILPHSIWLFFHDFITVKYAFARVSSPPTWQSHFHFPVLFAWQQMEVLLPCLFLFAVLFLGEKPITEHPRFQIKSFDKQFLFYVGCGPFILTLLLSAFVGMRLRAGWGEPLMSLWGLILIVWLQPRITVDRFYRFIAVLFTFLAILVTSYCIALIKAPEPSSANFPGKNIAITLTDEWHNNYHAPLKYVAGPRWLAGNIAFYSSDHPAVYINWDTNISPWIDEEKLKKEGAIFVWDPTEDIQRKPEEIISRFTKLGKVKIMHFTWMRNIDMTPVEINVAFLAPETR